MGRGLDRWPGRRGALACGVLVACASVALTLGIAALSASSAPSFAAPRSYPTGSEPYSVAIGDLNGDGKPELVTANGRYETNTISVLANRGDGTFRAKLDYATGLGPESVAIGDLNGDGKAELATANVAANSVSLFFNRGDGTFQAKRDYATGSGPFSVAIGDLNGDGKPDLATANANNGGAGTVSVLLNRGDGSFGTKVDYATGRFPTSVAVGDLNGDGRPELATANADANSVSVFLNRGDATFQAKRDYTTGLGPDSVVIGDLNGDGKPELATANGAANSISVLLNRGDGSFQAKLDYRTGHGPSSVAIGDLNGNGKPDLATANNDASSVSVLLSRGDGSFQAKVDYRTGREPYSVDSVLIGDLNGDGAPDLATANEDADAVSVLTNTGGGSFQPTLDYRTGRQPFSVATFSVAIGDLNGDGKQDLATANHDTNSVSVLLNTPGLCTVQEVRRRALPTAKRTIARANCRVGKIRRAYSTLKRGRVISQKPKPGTVLPKRGKVNLVVSRGRKR
jgi:hypothetical protein